MLFSAVSDQNIPLWRLIAEGKKTQTRRPIGDGFWPTDSEDRDIVGKTVLTGNERSGRIRIKWRVGRTYAVQPGRGKSTVQVARMRTVEGIDYHYPNMIEKDNCDLFWDCARPLRIKIVALSIHDVRMITEEDAKAEGFSDRLAFWRVWRGFYDPMKKANLDRDLFADGDSLFERPAELYRAWVIRFEVVS